MVQKIESVAKSAGLPAQVGTTAFLCLRDRLHSMIGENIAGLFLKQHRALSLRRRVASFHMAPGMEQQIVQRMPSTGAA